MHVVVFKCLPQICTKMNDFKFDFSTIFWGGAHRAPSPDLSPLFSQASPSVRASLSILRRFAPSTQALPSILGRFAPSIRASPSTFYWKTWFGPQNKFLDPLLSKHRGLPPLDFTSGYGPVSCVYILITVRMHWDRLVDERTDRQDRGMICKWFWNQPRVILKLNVAISTYLYSSSNNWSQLTWNGAHSPTVSTRPRADCHQLTSQPGSSSSLAFPSFDIPD